MQDQNPVQEWAARRTKGGGAEVVPQQEMPEGDSSDAHVILSEQAGKLGEVVEALDEINDPDESVIEMRNEIEAIQGKVDAKAKELGAQPTQEQSDEESIDE